MRLRQQLKWYLFGPLGRFRYFHETVYFPRWSSAFRAACEQGIFESDIAQLLINLTRPGTTFFDVGANIGLMAVPVLRSCPACRVVSFEPSPNSLPYLQRTAAKSTFGDRWTVISRALSRETGEVEFAVGRSRDALFEGFKSGARIPGAHTITVPVSTLDEEWRRLGEPSVSVVKIDVEGAEGLVLDGSRAVLETCRPYLIVEWNEGYLREFGTAPDVLLALADQFGYRIYTVPSRIPVDNKQALQVQLMICSNFLLMPLPPR